MKIKKSVGKYIVVASEITPESKGKFKVIDDSAFARAKVICGNDDFQVDDEVLFVRKDGAPVGHELPPNIMVVPVDSVVAIIEPEE